MPRRAKGGDEPLAEYRAKRDAAATPEPVPAAGPQAAGDGTRFVVQRHSARALHYDLRLEQDGVLRSWAIPKGLPTTPGARRLAVHTEDHPLEYLTFHGRIPEGQYGAGTMDVYDTGPYRVVEERRDGGLTFETEGERLRGRFTLVPAHLDGQERNWLLLRRDDPQSAAAAELERPRYDPMLATLGEHVPRNAGWLHEIKWDGFRILGRLEDGEPALWSRNGIDASERFRAVTVDLGRGLRSFDVVVDGEVCALDDTGRPSFGLLQRSGGTLVYYVFDVLELEGERLCDRPLRERRTILEELVDETSKAVRLSRTFEDGQALLEAARQHRLEGIISKRADSTYVAGRRSRSWVKVKLRQQDVLAIAGYTVGEGSRKRFGSFVLAARDGDDLVYAGNCGTGFTEGEIDRVLAELEPLRRDTSPLSRPIKDPKLGPKIRRRGVVWVEPELRARVEFTEWTNGGQLRAPVYKGLEPADAQIAHVPHTALEAAPPATADDPPARARELAGNLERVLFAADGITKGQLVEYYHRVAPSLLPHLAGRACVLRRAPEGIDGPAFFVKDVPDFAPDWLQRARIPAATRAKEGGEMEVAVVGDEDSLLWLVGIGCIDLHVTLSRIDRIDEPDQVLFDLDPAPGASFADVLDVARHVRDALDGLGLRCHAKTSGQTGVHVAVPIERGPDYAATRGFAQTVATAVERAYPKLATTEASTRRRKGVLIDWRQNHVGASLASPYSVRPVPGAPVSTPLRWEEVEEGLDPRELTMDVVLERVEEHGDLYAPVLAGGQSIARFVHGG